MPSNSIPSHIEDEKVDRKAQKRIERALKATEIAPTVAQQSGTYVDWSKVRDELGQPFDVDQIPLRKRRQMRRDPMIGFGGHYISTPIARAPWHMDAKDKTGANAQVAAFMDAAFRQIFARYIFTRMLSLYFGYQAMVKRFVEANPGGTYIDTREDDPTKREKPVWDEGRILPITWKPFVGLDPGRVQPLFDQAGQYAGINFDVPNSEQNKNLGFTSFKIRNDKTKREIDVNHALWCVNDRDSVWGSLWGYPRTSYAYRYWWSYWFRWAMSDRAFERHAVPPILAYHPEGTYKDPDTGEETPNWEIAIETARMLRSNSIAAVPSTLATAGLEEKGTTEREWEFKFLEPTGESFKFMDESFNYLDVMKLRSMWVPEQAFIEGEGGTSSRNVAAQMAEIFIQSQQNLWEEIADEINRFVLPQLLIVNFPEFVNNGGKCRIVGHGFAQEDIELLKQIIQLIGQQDASLLNVDMPEALSRVGIPTLSPSERAKEQAVIETSPTAPPPVTPKPGSVGVIPNPGGTNGGSIPNVSQNGNASTVMGFDDSMIYIQPHDMIELDDATDFLAALPSTHHFDDKTMKALALQMRKIWESHYRMLYPEFAQFIDKQDKIVLADSDYADEDGIMLADSVPKKTALKAANRLLKAWSIDSKRLKDLAGGSSSTIMKMMKRYSKLAQKAAGVNVDMPESDFQEYIDGQVGKLIKDAHKTVIDELRTFLVNQISEGGTAKTISKAIQDHFSDFPSWKADRVARSETRDAVNAATLLTADSADFKFVKASDGTTFDEKCRERDGKLFTVKEAWKEMRDTHPNDTLGFTMIPRADFSIEMRNGNGMPEDAPDGAIAFFDQEHGKLYFAQGIATDSDIYEFSGAVADKIIEEAVYG